MSIVNLTDLPGNMTGDLVLASEKEKDDPPAQMPTECLAGVHVTCVGVLVRACVRVCVCEVCVCV